MRAGPAMARVIARERWTEVPWRNGQGVTHMIWPQPDCDEYSGLQIHHTPIQQSGPFSLYQGFERILTLVAGSALVLTVDGAPVLIQPFVPVRFAGEASVEVHLVDGAVEVFNVIYSRDRWQEVDAIQPSSTAGLTIVHRGAGSLSTSVGAATKKLAKADTFLAEWPVVTEPSTGPFVHLRLQRR